VNIKQHPPGLLRELAVGLGRDRRRRRPMRGVLLTGLVVVTAGALAAPAQAHRVRSDAVAVWNMNAGRAAIAACISPAPNPLHESRLYAMTHVAIHDALNAIERRSEPYAFAGRAARGASLDAAVAAAARGVMVPVLGQQTPPFDGCIGAAVARVEADYAAALAPIPDGPAKRRGVAVGQQAAAAIVRLRHGDGADTPLLDFGYIEGTEPGEYRFTPGSPFAFAPGWARVTPFVLRDASQFRAGAPYDVTGRSYAADFNEVKELGSAGSTNRTAEQTEIARFWLESSPLQWNRIARTVATAHGLDPWKQARLFGLLNLALADGYIGSFETKYHYRYWRPVTAIHNAGTDGNPATEPDPGWAPLEPTPAIPDHDSAHSVEGGAAASVMKRVFGTDRVGFSACSSTLPPGSNCDEGTPVFRRYASFSQAAEENGISRILVGFHFRKGVDDGIEHGRRIGERAVNRYMRPTH
jgi:hypothetical protein